MNLSKHLTLIISFVVLLAIPAYSQPGPPGGGGGPGDPPCWPPSDCETPINDELIILLVAGLGLGIYFVKKEIVPSS